MEWGNGEMMDEKKVPTTQKRVARVSKTVFSMQKRAFKNIDTQNDTPPANGGAILICLNDIPPVVTFTARLPLLSGRFIRRIGRLVTVGVACPYCPGQHRHRMPHNWPRPVLRQAGCGRGMYLVLAAADAVALPCRCLADVVARPGPPAGRPGSPGRRGSGSHFRLRATTAYREHRQAGHTFRSCIDPSDFTPGNPAETERT